jgi:Family of unknown function (DUF6011)
MNATIRRNRYAADCAKGCGTRVQPESGALVKVNGRWGAEHFTGECPVLPVAAPANCGGCEDCDGEALCAPRPIAPVALVRPAVEVADGYYAVERGETLYFYRVVTKIDGRWAGRQFVNRFRSDDLLPVTRREQEDVRALIAADAEMARMRFAAELTRCYQCGKMLTDELSRALGIGPVCRAGGRD